MPAVCVAQFVGSLQSLEIRVVTAQWPGYWDTVVPAGAYTSASGHAVLTPAGRFNASCSVPSGQLDSIDGTAWPAGTYTVKARCSSALGDNPFGYGARQYSGHGTVSVANTGQPVSGGGIGSTVGSATITCNASYSGTLPGP